MCFRSFASKSLTFVWLQEVQLHRSLLLALHQHSAALVAVLALLEAALVRRAQLQRQEGLQRLACLVPTQAALRLPLAHLLKHQPLQPPAHQLLEPLVLGLNQHQQQQQLAEAPPLPPALVGVPAQQLRKAQVSTSPCRQQAQRQQQQHRQQQAGSTLGALVPAQQHLQQQAQHQLLQELAGLTLAVQLGP
jgi:hypothetical protein